jgi:glycosyltransferase involved in cell wall biosynthesis
MDQMTTLKRTDDARLPYVLLDKPRLDLTDGERAELTLSFNSSVWDDELYLVIDLYSAANQVHPQGHIGWWKWPLDAKGDLTVQVRKEADGFTVSFDDVAPQEFWRNPDYAGLDEPVVALHVVLRPVVSEAVRFDDVVHLYNSADALAQSDQRRLRLERPTGWVASSPWFVWPRESTVHLVSTNAFERDAVGNFALSLHRLFRANGIPCQLYASQFDPALRGTIRHTCELFDAAAKDDIVLLNFSIFEQWLPQLAELPSKKILYFHNITPPRFLQVYDAEYAVHCTDGLAQLKHLHQFDALMANSTSSARVLQATAQQSQRDDHGVPSNGAASAHLAERDVEVTIGPPIIGPKAWHDVEAEPIELPPQSTKLLYVGRIAPHKRIEDLFALFEFYHQLDPDSALIVVGASAFQGYRGFLQYLLRSEYAPLQDFIHFREHVSDGQLKTLYQSSSAFLTMSEHEGFCVPVVEAMTFDIPVFAFAEEAVLETLGRSGRVSYSKEFDAIASDLRSVLTTSWKQRSIIASQRERMKQIVQQADGQAFWATLEKVVYGARTV